MKQLKMNVKRFMIIIIQVKIKCVVNENGKIKLLRLYGIEDDQQNIINNIGKLTELQQLELLDFNFKSGLNYDPLKNLKKIEVLQINWYSSNALRRIPDFVFDLTTLKELSIIDNKITKFSDSIVNLKNLETFNLIGNRLSKFPQKLSELKNLKYINLSFNKIDDEIPESYNTLPKLEEIRLYSNENIKGKTLTNDSLKLCYYDENYTSLCIAKTVDCLIEDDY
eukprot:jgi/Orpsp1_1/1177065/evm.model.c7180000060061.1